MDSGIYLLQGDNTLVRMNETPNEAESLLQSLLEEHPDLLAGDQIDVSEPRRWLLVAREAGIPESDGSGDRWALDHLFLDQEAVPTFVEVKRATDTRTRREVVAQMLDYAAHASEHWPVDRMRELFATKCAVGGRDPSDVLAAFLGFAGDEGDFWNRASANLRVGRLRMLFVADRIPPALQRIVEFLNQQMSPAEVLAVEIKQFTSERDGTLRTLVPRVIGQSEQTRVAKASSQSRPAAAATDRATFLSDAPPALAATLREILSAAEATDLEARQFFRSGDSCRAVISTSTATGSPCSLDYEYLWISLGRYHPPLRQPDINDQLRRAILSVSPTTRSARDPRKTEVGIRLDSIEAGRFPTLRDLFRILAKGLEQGGAAAVTGDRVDD
jgi:hypothetical protein